MFAPIDDPICALSEICGSRVRGWPWPLAASIAEGFERVPLFQGGAEHCGGFTKGPQPTSHITAVSSGTHGPSRHEGRCITEEQNSTDPDGRASDLGRQVAEAGELRLKQQFHGADRAVAVLGHDHFSDAPIGCFRVVVLVAVDHQHQVSVLLD